MPLPLIPLATGEIELGGQKVEYHAIPASTAFKIWATDRAERGSLILSLSLDLTVEEVDAWLAVTPMAAAVDLMKAIVELSGLEDEVAILTESGPKA